jgi:PAS domain S-box-containing protein
MTQPAKMKNKHDYHLVTKNTCRQIVESTDDGGFFVDDQFIVDFINPNFSKIIGYPPEEILGKKIFSFIDRFQQKKAEELLFFEDSKLYKKTDLVFYKKNGSKIWTTISSTPIFDENKRYLGTMCLISDNTDLIRSETLFLKQKEVMDYLIHGKSLNESLDILTKTIEILENEVFASVLMVAEDGVHLKTVSSPQLPKRYNEAIENLKIGPSSGSCGTAAFLKKMIIVSDTFTDPLWTSFLEIAKDFNLRSCTIFSKDNQVLGTFALYFRNVRIPDENQVKLVDDLTAIAGLAIEFVKTKESLAKNALIMKKSEDEIKNFLEKEKQANKKATFLAEARKVLSSSLDFEPTLKNICELIAYEVADWCFVGLKVNGSLNVVSAAADSTRKKLVKKIEGLRFDLDKNKGLAQAMKLVKPTVYPKIEKSPITGLPDLSVIGTEDIRFLTLVESLGLSSFMIIPMVIRGEVIGVIFIASADGKRLYNESDLDLAVELGRSCSVAVDNSTLYQEAQKSIQVRNDFISIASHELRTPLTPLKMQVELLTKYVNSGMVKTNPEKINVLLTGASQDIDRLTKLVENLLDVSRIGAGRFELQLERVNFGEIVQSIIKRVSMTSESVLIRFKGETELWGTWDHSRLEQVVANILSNAIKYGRGNPITVILEKIGTNAILRVRDHGIGIDLGDQKKIFGRFERVASLKAFSGLGLGLYISSQIIKDHGGTIEVKSKLNEGSTFTICIPINLT